MRTNLKVCITLWDLLRRSSSFIRQTDYNVTICLLMSDRLKRSCILPKSNRILLYFKNQLIINKSTISLTRGT